MFRKLQSRRGETLVEALASILIAALSVALLFGCTIAATQINGMAEEADDVFYRALSAAEGQTADAAHPAKTGTVKIGRGGSSVTWSVTLYGGDGIYAYTREGGAGG